MYDISVRLHSEMTLWPNDRPPALDWERTHADGGGQASSRLTIGSHTGTHVDAPKHFLSEGSEIDDLPLEVLIGSAEVLAVEEVSLITKAALSEIEIERSTRRLLLKTNNSRNRPIEEAAPFDPEYVGLTPGAAEWLVMQGIRLVGIDYLSVEPFKRYNGKTHQVLLEGGVIILEGINLSGVPEGQYVLHCLPLKVATAEAAPARAVLTDYNGN